MLNALLTFEEISVNASILIQADPEQQMWVEVNVSDSGVGAMLSAFLQIRGCTPALTSPNISPRRSAIMI